MKTLVPGSNRRAVKKTVPGGSRIARLEAEVGCLRDELELEQQSRELLLETQGELELSRERYAVLYDLAPVGYLTLDRHGVIQDINLTGAAMLGEKRAAILGRPLQVFAAKADRRAVLHYLAAVRQGGATVITELTLAGRHTTPRLVELRSVRVLLNPASVCDHLLAAMTDITARKQAEATLRESEERARQNAFDLQTANLSLRESRRSALNLMDDALDARQQAEQSAAALRESEEKFRLIAENLEDVVWLRELPTQLTYYVNAAYARIWGRPPDDLRQGLSALLEPVHPEDRERYAAHLAQCEQGIRDLEYRVTRPDGCVRWIWERVYPLPNAGGPSVRLVGVATDITALKLAEQNLRDDAAKLEQRVKDRTRELQDSNTQLRREAEQRRRLEARILDISETEQRRIGQDLHDNVGSQLTGIEFLAQALVQDAAKVSRGIARRASTIARLLRSAMDDTRKLAHGLAPLPLDAHGLVLGLRNLAAHTRKVGRCPCTFRAAPSARITEPAQALHLYRIAQEALANAVKHSQATHIWMTLDAHRDTVLLRIHDDGRGLPQPPPDAGLGLLTMEIRADAMRGTLVVQRHPAGGTEVICTVPGCLESVKPTKSS
jgi:PAS domain S-box-containing protein